MVYGLKPEDFAHVSHLGGAEVIFVGVGQYQLQFGFHPAGDISVEGRCELYDAGGELVDVWQDGRRSEPFRFLDLLGQSVAEVAIDTPRSFKLVFESGTVLRLVDNSDQFESFSVGDLYV